MNVSQFKKHLDTVSILTFVQPNGTIVPQHFHITEAGLTTKHFIDCGGTVRTEKSISMQVWVANDTDHRLEPQKLKGILAKAETLFSNEDLEMEIEYQMETISRFGLDFNGQNFLLTPKHTDCLAQDHCGIPAEKQKLNLSDLQTAPAACCTTEGACC